MLSVPVSTGLIESGNQPVILKKMSLTLFLNIFKMHFTQKTFKLVNCLLVCFKVREKDDALNIEHDRIKYANHMERRRYIVIEILSKSS